MRSLGRFKLHAISDGTFALDGGAMFGIVPKPLWEKHFPADERNRVRLALRCLLIEDGDRLILVDDGIGSKWSDKELDLYGIDQSGASLDRQLGALGWARADITDVVLTHLHFDHAGGTTTRGPDGVLALAFPSATHHLQRRNLEWANGPTEKDAGSYLRENFETLERAGRLRLWEGEGEVHPGIRLLPSDGHTIGLQLVRIDSEEGSVLYCADLIPTAAHLRTSWIMGYDLQPLVCLQEKKALLRRALAEEWILFFEHDPRHA
ncbi:MAG: MBL fold metallo-hydrolase, partial [Deltaproteobacteria bacterium]